MRISSSSFTLLALSLSTANGALSLPTRQLSSALESIQQSTKNSLTHKKSLIRALQGEIDAESQACLVALIGTMEEDDNPMAFMDELNFSDSNICDYSTGIGICDLSDSNVECDQSTGKIITNDMLMCKENNPEGTVGPVDMVINNIPYCFPKICPDDTNMIEMMTMLIQMFIGELGGNETDTGEDGADMFEAFTKQQCDSGTKLSDHTGDEHTSGDHSHSHSDDGTDSADSSDASVRSMILSFSVAAAVGIGAFLTV